MNIIKLDVFDGRGQIEVVAENDVAAARLRRFSIGAGEAFTDQERWEKVRKLMTHEKAGPHVGWTLGIALPGEDPDDAIDKAEAE